MDQDNAASLSASASVLGKKAWTAYIGTTLLAVLFLVIIVPMAWRYAWLAGLIVLILASAFILYRVLTLMSVSLYCDDVGVWVYSGVLPWNKGISGVKWRDLDEATYYQNMWSWLFKSYSMRIGHRFTKSSEILLTHIGRGQNAVTEINERHQELVRNNSLN